MANTLSDVVPVLVAQGLQTLRAACVMPRLVNTDYSNNPSNQGDTVNVWIPSAMTVSDVAPTAAPATPGDISPTKAPIPLDQWRHTGFFLTDKQQEEIVGGVQSKQTGEAVKALAEDINSFIFGKYLGVYGYAGTAGTTPFASDVSAATAARKVLNLQRAPLSDRRLVLDVNAEANALGLPALTTFQNTGNAQGIIEGTIGRKLGFDWAMDQQIPTHTAGTITTGLISKAATAYAIGVKTITATTAASTGACALKKGDIITFAGDTQTYTLTADATQASAASDVTLSFEPGLAVAHVGSEAVSVKASHVVNLAFHRDAFAFVSRPLQAVSANTVEMMSVPDPVSGVTLRLEVVRQNKQLYFDFDVLYGAACVRPELACRIAG